MPDLQALLRGRDPPVRITIVDAGAAQFEDHHARLVSLAERYGGEVFAFEPAAEQYRELTRLFAGRPHVRVLPLALGDGKEHELKICRHPGATSLLEPNFAVAGRYQAFGEWMEVVERTRLKTVAPDDVEEIAGADFLKIDIQGFELAALTCAPRLLSRLLAIECEVNFVQQYVDQPLFAEIELFLRRHGFMFHKFCGYGSRTLKPVCRDGDPLSPGNQWLWSDAVLIRDIAHWTGLSDDRLIRLAVLMHELYGSDDFAFHALSIVDARAGTRTAADFAALAGLTMHAVPSRHSRAGP